ncbi:hypothetical protein BCR34DRAFT_582300 [Clohesyomyces aquaticus]|uniref:Uncharacterized protein n=1 Tax=Clohesyomyces aquaticus TaxID=1231657 RepID=A0A1Y2AAT4_9PLEO|nr:hypothetical protein BCR34DRAFT_582300 [Clohesyomyces aquaticus]
MPGRYDIQSMEVRAKQEPDDSSSTPSPSSFSSRSEHHIDAPFSPEPAYWVIHTHYTQASGDASGSGGIGDKNVEDGQPMAKAPEAETRMETFHSLKPSYAPENTYQQLPRSPKLRRRASRPRTLGQMVQAALNKENIGPEEPSHLRTFGASPASSDGSCSSTASTCSEEWTWPEDKTYREAFQGATGSLPPDVIENMVNHGELVVDDAGIRYSNDKKLILIEEEPLARSFAREEAKEHVWKTLRRISYTEDEPDRPGTPFEITQEDTHLEYFPTVVEGSLGARRKLVRFSLRRSALTEHGESVVEPAFSKDGRSAKGKDRSDEGELVFPFDDDETAGSRVTASAHHFNESRYISHPQPPWRRGTNVSRGIHITKDE